MPALVPLETPIPPLVSMNDLHHWLWTAAPGDRLCYFVGSLANAVGRGGDPELRQVAGTALVAANQGTAVLTQRRVTEGQYEYFITKTAALDKARARA